MNKFAFFLFFLLLPLFIWGQEEKIHRFHAEIVVDTSGVIKVEETISIYAAGGLFKRGIVRGLPRTRPDSAGVDTRVSYNIKSITRNGNTEDYHTRHEDGEKRLYIGEEDVFLQPGDYTYTITYESDHQIRFYENFDELYWNVNGVGGAVKIDTISATLQLPKGVSPINSICYTGTGGSTSQNCEQNTNGNTINYMYLPNYSNELLTIAVSFPKNIVTPPPPPTFFQKTGSLLLGAIVTIFLLFYYLFTWRRFGVDPEKPVAYPQFSPPDNLSPASVGMLKRGIYWSDLITASIINLAVKGYVKIEEVSKEGFFGFFKDKTYIIRKLKKASPDLPEEEQTFMEYMFDRAGKNAVEFDGEYDKSIEKAVNKFQKDLNKQWNPLLWKGFHAQFWILPILTLIAYFFLFVVLFNAYFSRANSLKYFILFMVFNIILFFIYQWLIRKPAKEKLRLKSLIQGFEMYLSAAEEKQIQHFNPPKLTPQQFEKMLPFAIALDVEKVWGKQFQQLLDQMSQETDYQPTWYNGSFSNAGKFSHSLNSSLSNSLQHSSTKPSSSSGSGGGGFSGGGGGGGSVGGW